MTLSPQLGLSYLVPEQAQKHVTVNETFRLLDALVQMSAKQTEANAPPASPIEGDLYTLGNAPTGAWRDKANKLAIFQDGAWVFVTPKTGWRLFDLSQATHKTFKSGRWTAEASGGSGGGGALVDGLAFSALEVEHTITAGTFNNTSLIIPDRALVLGVTARVSQAMNVKWKLGVGDGIDRYGSQIGAEMGAINVGVSGAPTAYYANTPLRLSAQTGRLSRGRVKLRLYLMRLSLPDA